MEAKYQIADIHCHVLPGIDDGALDIDMAIEMLRSAALQGVCDIFCTSHSWGFRENYGPQLDALRKRAAHEGLRIRLHSGCEIACCEEILQSVTAALSDCTMNGTDFAMLEFYPDAEPGEIFSCIGHIMNSTGCRIILAHAERYEKLGSAPDMLDRIAGLGCLIQINAYSLVEEKNQRIKAFARRLLDQRLVSFVGSDAHRTTHRPVSIASGVRYIYDRCEKKYAQAVCFDNAVRYLRAGEAG